MTTIIIRCSTRPGWSQRLEAAGTADDHIEQRMRRIAELELSRTKQPTFEVSAEPAELDRAPIRFVLEVDRRALFATRLERL